MLLQAAMRECGKPRKAGLKPVIRFCCCLLHGGLGLALHPGPRPRPCTAFARQKEVTALPTCHPAPSVHGPRDQLTLTSRSLPVCMDHTKISKESCAPAETISPLESTATQENCVGRGDVKVRKFRYLNKNKVRVDSHTHLHLLSARPHRNWGPSA